MFIIAYRYDDFFAIFSAIPSNTVVVLKLYASTVKVVSQQTVKHAGVI